MYITVFVSVSGSARFEESRVPPTSIPIVVHESPRRGIHGLFIYAYLDYRMNVLLIVV